MSTIPRGYVFRQAGVDLTYVRHLAGISTFQLHRAELATRRYDALAWVLYRAGRQKEARALRQRL
ncbi:MAG: hypothetical protein WDO73_00135 [Ignavibacteriota bacterium]